MKNELVMQLHTTALGPIADGFTGSAEFQSRVPNLF